MDSKFFKLCLLAGIAAGMCACDEGKYNDLKCDSNDFQAECLSTNSYMTCAEGTLKVVLCQETAYCKNVVGEDGSVAATCVPYKGSASANTCGDNIVGLDEECDGNNLNGKTCADLIPGTTGTPSCNACKFDTSSCTPAGDDACGDGVISGNEDCEGTNLNGKTCGDVFKGTTGDLACNPRTCFFDGTNCNVPEREPGFCKSDEDCDDGQCLTGVCVTEEMREIQEGDPCSVSTFEEFCLDDVIYYCAPDRDEEGEYVLDDDENYVYVVTLDECGEYGGCTVIDISSFYGMDEPLLSAWCKNATNTMSNDEAEAFCTESGRIPYCLSDDEYGDFESYIYCSQNSDGSLTAVDGLAFSEYSWCYDETGEDYGYCADDGEHCENFYAYYCDIDFSCLDGSNLAYCDDTYAAYGIVSSGEVACADAIEGSVCATVNNNDYCYVPCDKLNDSSLTCGYDEEYEISFYSKTVCTKGKDGNLYEVEVDSDYCNNECIDGEGCKTYASDEGSSCDELYLERCENNAIVTCGYDETVESYLCDGDTVCHVDEDDRARCLEPCETDGESITTCETGSLLGMTYSYESTIECQELDDGLFYVQTSSMYCERGCSEDEDKPGCIKLFDDEGKPCDNPDTLVGCSGDILVWCDEDGTLSPINCAAGGFDTCKYSPTLEAYSCVSECDEPTGIIPKCVNNEEAGYSLLYDTICEEVDDVLYNFLKAGDVCESTCNEERDGCAE